MVFVRLYLHAGRFGSPGVFAACSTLVLVLNFVFIPVISITGKLQTSASFHGGGRSVSVPVGTPNPWGLLVPISLLLLLIFSVDAAITVWRRGDRRRALLVCGSMIFGAILPWTRPVGDLGSD